MANDKEPVDADFVEAATADGADPGAAEQPIDDETLQQLLETEEEVATKVEELMEESRFFEDSRDRWRAAALIGAVGWIMLAMTLVLNWTEPDRVVIDDYPDDLPAIEQPAHTAPPSPAPADATPTTGIKRRF